MFTAGNGPVGRNAKGGCPIAITVTAISAIIMITSTRMAKVYDQIDVADVKQFTSSRGQAACPPVTGWRMDAGPIRPAP